MRFQRFGERYQVRVESGEPVAATLLSWLTARDIGYAAISGLGAVRSATVAYWNSQTAAYEPHVLEEQMEVVSLIGNVTVKDGARFLHIHVSLGRSDLSVVGGHLNEMIVHPNLELWLRVEAQAVHRALDESCGLYLMDLPERP